MRILDIPAISLPGAFTPPDVTRWLGQLGWHPAHVNGNEVFTHGGNSALLHFTWEQAVAYEFYRFISLGGAHGPREG